MSDESFIKVNINLEKPTQLSDHRTTTHFRERKENDSKQSSQHNRPILLDCQTVAYCLKMSRMVIIGRLAHIPSIGKALQTDLVYTYTRHYTN